MNLHGCGLFARMAHGFKRYRDGPVIAEILRREKRHALSQEYWKMFIHLYGNDHWRCRCAPPRPYFVEPETDGIFVERPK